MDQTDTLPRAPHDHVVNFYDDPAALAEDVLRYVTEGLAAGEIAIVVARPELTSTLRDGLDHRSDLAPALAAGRFVALDAADALGRFMVDGSPSPTGFDVVIGEVMREAVDTGRPIRAFGEMVALLWADGNVTGAIALEALWNDLGRELPFSLYCAYPSMSMADGDLDAVRQVCDHHSALIAPRSYDDITPASPGDAPDERSELFLPIPFAVRAVRRLVLRTLASWDLGSLAHDATVVASELATNAVVHAHGPFRVSLRRTPSTVRIEVVDLSARAPFRPDQPRDAIGGRGVALVAGLCADWGSEPQAGGKLVWAELATPTVLT